MLHVAVTPAPPTALIASATARRIIKSITVQYQSSGVIARLLRLEPHNLGKITSAASLILRLSLWPRRKPMCQKSLSVCIPTRSSTQEGPCDLPSFMGFVKTQEPELAPDPLER